MSDKRTPIPNWLQALQENSWELELLISGGAVFTLVQAPDLLQDWMLGFLSIHDLDAAPIFFLGGMLGIKILTNGFILHLLLRSYWLALVCVNYVFPQGINSRKVQLKFPFKASDIEGDLQEQIMKVDRLSGLVIFISILSTIVLAGLTVLFFLFLTYEFNSEKFFSPIVYEIFSNIFSISIVFYITDLLFMGFFRKIPYLSYLFFPFFFIYDFITLRLFYVRAIVLFSSNVKRWPFRSGAFIFMIITFGSTLLSINHFRQGISFFDSRDYTDKLSKNNSVADWKYADVCPHSYSMAYIPSKIIENNFLTVGIGYKPWMDNLIRSSTKVDSLKYVDRIFEVSIDDSLYSNIVWRGVHRMDFPSSGLEAFLNISNLANGEHILKIKLKDFPDAEYREYVRLNAASDKYPLFIPFCKDVY